MDWKRVHPNPPYEIEFARDLAQQCSPAEILALYRRFDHGEERIDYLMRRTCVRALARRCGHGLRIEPRVGLRHPRNVRDRLRRGDRRAGHPPGTARRLLRVDRRQGLDRSASAYLDAARDVVIGDNVGWGPGARLLQGSRHTGEPDDWPIIETDLLITLTVVEADADIGVNAVLMPGVRIGRGAMVGAGAVVTRNVPSFAKVAGVPARVIGFRKAAARQGEPA